ncbi:hypothetical protein L1987_06257 [Smallanthus sonchifolius]|uniref:Uncharacterized protein n=1 Tax=Smallanthus sonchifolius TaxID=185202 RepID=A0ACB9JXT0_9ASTR|nr:hypothetical protein L1987_06257 [Smallanthus sonchifolius]
MFNTAMGGHIMDKLEPAEYEEMFESFALAEHQQPSTRTSIPSARAPASSPRGVDQVTLDTSVAAALAAMENEIKEMKLSSQSSEVCRGSHDTRDCPVNHQEQVSFAGNQNPNLGYNNYNNTYGSGWRSGNNPPWFNALHNQYGGVKAGASSGSSVSIRKIEEMIENQTQMLAHSVQQDRDARERLDAYDTLFKYQQSAFQDLQHMVGDIAKSLRDRQGGPSSGPNASVMAVSIRSRGVEKEVSHNTDYGIPSLEEEVESAEVTEPRTSVKAMSTRSRRVEEKESPPVVEEEPVDEEIVLEKPAEKAEENKSGGEIKTP